ncbi:MAG: winged helix-turn-helix transcriptional regulator [Candidatus Wallbacteria bacterium]|nr:winged helix-turn-helix transcriptional regulator [Candidatus Wallbacteria bacterium]
MGTEAGRGAVLEALFGKARRRLLALFFGEPGQALHLLEIVRRLGMGRGAVQRELARLAGAGLVTRVRRGNRVYFQAARNCPSFEQLRELLASGEIVNPPAAAVWRPPENRGGLPID